MAVHCKQYTKEFKEEGVRLITQGGVSLAQVSRDLDVNQSILPCWKQELEQHGVAGQGVPTEQDLARLRCENEVLRLERKVLKRLSPSSRNTIPEAHLYPRAQRPVRGRVDGRVLGIRRECQYLLRMEEASTRRTSKARPAIGQKIEQVFYDSRGGYGSPRVHQELRAMGEKRATRLMRQHKLAVKPRLWQPPIKHSKAAVQQVGSRRFAVEQIEALKCV